MLRELLLLAHLLAISLGEGYAPLGAHPLHLANKVVGDPISHVYTGAHRAFLRDAPGIRARSYAGYYAGKSIAPIDGRIAAIDGRRYIPGAPLADAGFLGQRIGATFGHYYGHPGAPALRPYGVGVDGTKVAVQRPLPPAPVTVREAPIVPPPPIAQQVVQRPVPPPVTVQQVVDRPPIRRPDPAAFYGARSGLYAPHLNRYSSIYGGSFLNPYSYGASPFYARHGYARGSLISGTYPLGVNHAQSLEITAKRQEEIRRRAAYAPDGRLAYSAGRVPVASLGRSHLDHLYSPYSTYAPHSLYGFSYGDVHTRLADPRLRYRSPFNAVGFGGIHRPTPFATGIVAPGVAGYNPLAAHHYNDRHLYRPSSIVSPFSYGSYGSFYGHAGLRGDLRRPISYSPYDARLGAYAGRYIPGANAIRRPFAYSPGPVPGPIKAPVVVPPVVERSPVIPRPEIPPAPPAPQKTIQPIPVRAPIYNQVKRPIVAPAPAPIGGLAGVVSAPAFYQPRRLPELTGRRVAELYRGEPFVQPRRLPDTFNPIVTGAAVAPNYAGIIAQQRIARPLPAVAPGYHHTPFHAAHIPHITGHSLVSPYAYHTPYTYGNIAGTTKVVEPVVAHDPFPAVSAAAVQKSIHSGPVVKV